MQFHLNGFNPGDPRKARQGEQRTYPGDQTDVLIVGCGPAGLTLAAQLATIGGIDVRIMERKSGPLAVGQADGIACRSMEMFEAFGFAHEVMAEAYWVNETTFWRPDSAKGLLHRADRILDVEDDLSHMPHVILNQARVHDHLLDVMQFSPLALVPEYERELVDVSRDNDPDYPICATFARSNGNGELENVRARYLVGCDGARSQVRASMDLDLKGEAARQLWGVMDVLCVTDFPDIRLKSAIQSAGHGSMLIIPREGGYMVRLYIELDNLAEGERAADRNVTSDMLADKARQIIAPYSFGVREVAWWSAYEIGQRVCETFDDGNMRNPRVFIAGDACHTHSPKAGQGMNVSMADTFNLGWKLAAVVQGRARSDILKTYSGERQAKAQELIDFDRDMARLFSKGVTQESDAARFQVYFQKHGRFTAGVETTYAPSLLVGDKNHQALAGQLVVGKRFHGAPVVRLADAKPMHLSQVLVADGRWRLIAFAGSGDIGQTDRGIARLCDWLERDVNSPMVKFTPPGQDPDSIVDFRVVFQSGHRDIDLNKLPGALMPVKGELGLVDYEKAFCPSTIRREDIFDRREIDRRDGALVVVRPDQFVAQVLPLNCFAELASFFDGFMLPSGGFASLPPAMRDGATR